MAIADIEGISEERIHKVAHSLGRCGGFEDLSSRSNFLPLHIEKELMSLEEKLKTDSEQSIRSNFTIKKNEKVMELSDLVSSQNLRESVKWMEEMGTRYHRAADPNRPVVELERRLREMLRTSKIPYTIELISHTGTKQKSLKLTFTGATEPDKKIILGAHFDSIVMWGGASAPGADDNASGSSNLIEVARILSQHIQPKRSIEFFWYAGEEGGLIGSAEIAKSYKSESQDVLAVMQLDMTLYPGDGPFVIGSVTDYTSPWVRELLLQINSTYFNYQVLGFDCGYACSDHASWYKQGFSTVAPFEARKNSMNRQIHTSRDKIQPSYNFDHSAAFSKLALAFALELDVFDISLVK